MPSIFSTSVSETLLPSGPDPPSRRACGSEDTHRRHSTSGHPVRGLAQALAVLHQVPASHTGDLAHLPSSRLQPRANANARPWSPGECVRRSEFVLLRLTCCPISQVIFSSFKKALILWNINSCPTRFINWMQSQSKFPRWVLWHSGVELCLP